MSTLDVCFLAIALGMDCFTVSISCGIIQKNMLWKQVITMSLMFGFMQAAMPIIGWATTNLFEQYIQNYSHWLAFALLVGLGGKMIIDSFKKDNQECHFDPSRFLTIFTLSIATSIDAMAIGISFNCVGLKDLSSLIAPILIIGFASSVMSIAGKAVGVFVGKKFNLNAEIFGGIILILIAIKIIIEQYYTI